MAVDAQMESEMRALLEKAELATSTFLLDKAVPEVKKRLQENAFTMYDWYRSPATHPYKRRWDNGGVADKRFYHDVFSSYTEFKIYDNRFETERFSSGFGYDWENSAIFGMQPFPRPFFEYTDSEVAELLDKKLEAWLKRNV